MSDTDVYYYTQKKAQFEAMKNSYIANGEVDWATFKAAPATHQKKVVTLQQSDFANGTLRVQYPCCLKLTENISFNPNRPTTWLNSSNVVTGDFSQAAKLDPNRVLDWWPDATNGIDNTQYFTADVAFAYGLGFFAAITLECENIVVNLNNYKLAQHPEHALQQRFFALIELADQPFMPLQGPSNFGSVLRTAKNVYIHNGKIGLSSHHGIHGNDGGNDIMIEDVDFCDFEVAAFALNGFKNIYMKNVCACNNRQDIPILGTYSAARFIELFVKKAVSKGHSNSSLNTAMTNLKTEMDNCFNAVIFNNGSVPSLFENATGLIDGNCYGFLINPAGIAVNQFLEDRANSKANDATNIYIVNCNVNNIKGKINEIICVANPNGGFQVDTAGSVFQFFNGIANLIGDKYFYQGTVLSEVQIELAKIKYTLSNASPPTSTSYLGTLNIHKGMADWKDNSALYFKLDNGVLKLYNTGDVPHQVNSQNVEYVIHCNGDSMFHVNKGVIGFRIDGANHMVMANCGICHITNEGVKGSLLCGNYVSSHPLQGPKMIGYNGAKTYGLVLSAVNDFKCFNTQIMDIESKNSSAYGLSIQNSSLNTCFSNLCVHDIYSNKDATFSPDDVGLPNEVPISRGVHVAHDCHNCKFLNPHLEHVVNSAGNPYDSSLEFKAFCLSSGTG